MIIVSRIIHVTVGWYRTNAKNNFKDLRRPLNSLSTVQFRGTPCIFDICVSITKKTLSSLLMIKI